MRPYGLREEKSVQTRPVRVSGLRPRIGEDELWRWLMTRRRRAELAGELSLIHI